MTYEQIWPGIWGTENELANEEPFDPRINSEDPLIWEFVRDTTLEESQANSNSSLLSAASVSDSTISPMEHSEQMKTNLQSAWHYLSQIVVSNEQDQNILANHVREMEFPPVFSLLLDHYYASLNSIRPRLNQQTKCGLSIKGKSGSFVIKGDSLSEIRLIKSLDKKNPAEWEITVIVPLPEENKVDLPINIIFPISIGMQRKNSVSHNGGRIVATFTYLSAEQVSLEKEDLKIVISGHERIYPVKVYTSRSSKTKQTYFEFEASFL